MRHILKKIAYNNILARKIAKKTNDYLESNKIVLSKRHFSTDKHYFVIIIPAYNALAFYQKNLLSVFEQNYKHFRIIYIDDYSTDGTGDSVARLIEKYSPNVPFELRRNESNVGALANLYDAIWSCQDHEIIITLDGDDWLANDWVLKILNHTYATTDTWLTYGQYITYPMYSSGCCEELPRYLLTSERCDEIRKYRWVTSHLRTFYAGLFKKIRQEDLMWQNEYSRVAWDFAIMLPMLEMALHRSQFIPDILHIYNDDHPLNDHHIRRLAQKEAEAYFRALPPYTPLETLL